MPLEDNAHLTATEAVLTRVQATTAGVNAATSRRSHVTLPRNPNGPAASMIVCAAVIGQTNRPLYIRCYADDHPDSTIKFNYIVHCALDAVEEKILTMPRKPNEALESYLGLLYPTEDYKVYGYISSTNTKFVLVFDDPVLKEDDVKLMFNQFYNAYVNAVSNPFYTFGTQLKSPIFEAKMEALSKGVA